MSKNLEAARERITELLKDLGIDPDGLEVEPGYRFNYLARINGEIIGEYSSKTRRLILWSKAE